MATEVTVRDTETGESYGVTFDGGYFLVTSGDCREVGVTAADATTHVITVENVPVFFLVEKIIRSQHMAPSTECGSSHA